MAFTISDKVALITGGASGLGLQYAKELLRQGLKGVTLADLNQEFGQNALQEIEREFGTNKAIFVKTDVTNIHEFEDAFQQTVEKFQNIDILINNAGILNDSVWEKEIAINVNGVIHGVLLGIDNYLPKYKKGPEAVIVNISSTCGVAGYGHIPVYCGTKFAVIGMTKSWSVPYHFDRSKVRVIAVCPGVTITPLITDIFGRNLGGCYEEYLQDNREGWLTQEKDFVATEMVKLIQFAANGTVWIIEGGEPAYEYILPERETMKENKLKQ